MPIRTVYIYVQCSCVTDINSLYVLNVHVSIQ